MRYKKHIFLLISIFGINIALCGAGILSKPNVEIDTNKHKVYRSYSIEEITQGQAESNFGLCYVIGKIEEISDNKKSVTISNGNLDIIIKLETDDVIEDVKKLKLSDSVQVFGTAKKKKKDYYIKVSSISINNSINKTGITYYLENGKSASKDDMVECSLNEGQIKYYVPKSWKAKDVEFNIIDNDLGYIDGYQYVLNKIPGSDANSPESFFVCYFKYDGNLQKNTSVKKIKPIEQAIVKSIEDSDFNISKPTEIPTYYGATYHYYQGSYHDPLQVNGDYYTEYIFEKNGDDGLVMYLYVYKKASHIDEIMLVTRLLEN